MWNICDTFRCVLDKHSTNIIIFCKLLKHYSIYLCPLPPQAKFGSRYIGITLKVCLSAIMSGPGFVMSWPKVIWASPRLLKGKVQNERNIQIFLFDKHLINRAYPKLPHYLTILHRMSWYTLNAQCSLVECINKY